MTEVTAVTARNLVNAVTGTTNTVTDLGTRSGNGYTGVTFYEGTVADDTDPDTAFTGTLTCPTGTACSATRNADGTFAVEGYTFAGSREAREAVAAVAAAENAEYLAFGVWLQEDGDGNGTADDPAFGAFQGGGSAVTTDTYGGAPVTGTATYNGAATGVYTAGDSVDYFQGDATLTANFGAPGTATDPEADDDELGTITGRIHNIVAGGADMSDVIHLNTDGTPEDGNISATGAISGNVRMGMATVTDNVATIPTTAVGARSSTTGLRMTPTPRMSWNTMWRRVPLQAPSVSPE